MMVVVEMVVVVLEEVGVGGGGGGGDVGLLARAHTPYTQSPLSERLRPTQINQAYEGFVSSCLPVCLSAFYSVCLAYHVHLWPCACLWFAKLCMADRLIDRGRCKRESVDSEALPT